MSSLPSRRRTPEHSSAKRHPPKNELKLCGCWRNIAMSLTGSSVLSAIAWLHQQPPRAEVDYGHSEHQEHRQEQHRKIFVLPSRVHVLRGGRGRPSLSVSRQSGGFRNCHVACRTQSNNSDALHPKGKYSSPRRGSAGFFSAPWKASREPYPLELRCLHRG